MLIQGEMGWWHLQAGRCQGGERRIKIKGQSRKKGDLGRQEQGFRVGASRGCSAFGAGLLPRLCDVGTQPHHPSCPRGDFLQVSGCSPPLPPSTASASSPVLPPCCAGAACSPQPLLPHGASLHEQQPRRAGRLKILPGEDPRGHVGHGRAFSPFFFIIFSGFSLPRSSA